MKKNSYRLIRCPTLLFLLMAILPVSTTLAREPRDEQGVKDISSRIAGLAFYPPDPTTDIPWNVGTNGVADIQAAFNNARVTENNQLGKTIPMLSLPSQVEWDGVSDGQKALSGKNRRGILRPAPPPPSQTPS